MVVETGFTLGMARDKIKEMSKKHSGRFYNHKYLGEKYTDSNSQTLGHMKHICWYHKYKLLAILSLVKTLSQ